MTTAQDPWNDPRVVAGLQTQLAAWRTALGDGAGRIGWKVGFGAPASLELMQINAPLLGHLTDTTQLAPGAVVDVGSWEQGIVEFEVAVAMAADVEPDASAKDAAGSVAALGPAIELANIDLPIGPKHVEHIVAGNIFHRSVIFGDFDAGRAGLDISGLTAHIAVDGAERSVVTQLEALTGDYGGIVATVAKTLAGHGERLRAGDVIITGSVIAPIPVSAGRVFTFSLRPMEPIAVTVEGSQ